MTNHDTDSCPICTEPFKPEDICASDITKGTCHAVCLEGAPVVNLETGEETGGTVDTYPHSEVMQPSRWTPWQGGETPVTEGTEVEVILRYGKQALAQAGSGYASRWSYDGKHGDHDDIVFYRFVCPTPLNHSLDVNDRPAEHFAQGDAIPISNQDTFLVDLGISHDALGQHLLHEPDGIVVGLLKTGEVNTNRIPFEGSTSTDVEKEPRHAPSGISGVSNSHNGKRFPPPAYLTHLDVDAAARVFLEGRPEVENIIGLAEFRSLFVKAVLASTPSPQNHVKRNAAILEALENIELPVVGHLFVARGGATARLSSHELANGPDESSHLVRLSDVTKALEPIRAALATEGKANG